MNHSRSHTGDWKDSRIRSAGGNHLCEWATRRQEWIELRGMEQRMAGGGEGSGIKGGKGRIAGLWEIGSGSGTVLG
jgi:hypothetical protein